MGSGAKAPEAAEVISRIFVLKATLQSLRLLLTVLQENGEQDVLLALPIILVPAPMNNMTL